MRKTVPVAAFLLAAAAMMPGPSVVAQDEPQPTAIDYDGFVALAGELGEYREGRLLGWEEWQRRATLPGAIILDTRSESAFAMGHIEGAVNLPFSDFTEDKLAQIVGHPETPIFIYCNNNFSDNVAPLLLKRMELALNIPTFINLHGYGYRNIWELGDTVNLHDVPWNGHIIASPPQAGAD
ncbi:rhodanese-like domain-containing protein [Aurantiacibacter gangjinensis]|uniref:Uncharacterized protein n=1 Tax=Aurantiacibacter gangjinensis TaxID=502682 RepID=A0A0G9MKB9_9SPHN|nr:rhodanese-like domain-containing protein [Aurantiacibacter gangjinensis]APE29289.1 rhodanese-like domain protein [Aurantiacibacter gangjinensis]KLE31112.1 hypothetical protein AAW01_12845 [Aurantiacibacter gangjinensis]